MHSDKGFVSSLCDDLIDINGKLIVIADRNESFWTDSDIDLLILIKLIAL